MKQFFTLALAGTSLFVYSQTNNHSNGRITGTVIDESGSPVVAATVYVVPQGVAFDDITPRSVKTNASGAFDFRGPLQLGTYKVYSRKDEDAYPDRSDGFYADTTTEAPKVDVTEDHPAAVVTVTLGEKAAVLAGRVMDARGGAAMKAKLVFMDEAGNDHSVLVNGQYRVLLPAWKPVTLMVMVMSPDYRPQAELPRFELEPGQKMHLNIPISKQ
jgi:hypothetical protein